MNIAGFTIAAAVAVFWSAAAWSQEPDAAGGDAAQAAAPAPNPAADTPYANIVARNMFALVPIPPPDPHAGEPPTDPPPKITPTGIMTIFGRDQALFTAAGPSKPGQPAKDDAYVLAEGERQDDIEVVKINHETSIITFNNHGTIQELPLVPPKDSGPVAGPGGGGPGGGGPGFPGRRPGFPGISPRNFGRGMGTASAGMGNPGFGGENNSTGRGNGFGGSSFGSANVGGGTTAFSGGFNSTAANNSQPDANIEDEVMNAARQMALIEQNRIDTQEMVDQGKLPPLPPTMLTPSDATGNNGQPLVTLPTIPTGK